MPEGAQPPQKPEGYAEEAKAFLQQLIEKAGLVLNPPTHKGSTIPAHIGSQFAREKGVLSAYQKEVFAAVWQRDQNIEDVNVLTSIAERIGLSGPDFEQALQDRKYQRMVESDLDRAAKNKVWTIPAYEGRQGAIYVHHFKDLPDLEGLKSII